MKATLIALILPLAAANAQEPATIAAAREAWESGRPAEAETLLGRLPSESRLPAEMRARALLLQAVLALHSDDPARIDAAITALGQASALDESLRIPALGLQGDAKLLLQRPEEAGAIHRAVLEQKPAEPWRTRARIGAAIADSAGSRHRKAAVALDSASADPDAPVPLRLESACRAAAAWITAGRAPEAAASLQHALRLSEESATETGNAWIQAAALTLPDLPEMLPLLDQAAALGGSMEPRLDEKAGRIRLIHRVWE